MKDVRKKSFYLRVIVMSSIVSLVYLFNFFHQARYGGIECDTWYHLRYVRSLIEANDLPKSQQGYPMFFYLIALGVKITGNYSISAFIFIMVWSFMTNVIQIMVLKSFLEDFSERYIILTGSALSFLWPISYKVFRPLFTDSSYWNNMLGVYLRSGATAPYQNLTYLCSKPFAILSVYFFIRIFESKEKEVRKPLVWFGITLFLSVLAKPNFYQCFAPAGVIVTIIFFLKNGKKEFFRCLKVAIAYLPATFWVLYSMTMKVQPVGISPFEGINYFDDGLSIPIVLIRAIVFALFTLVCAIYYKYYDRLTLVAILTYVFGTLEWLMLIFPLEKGALDMLWGYDVAMYILFFATIVIAARLYELKKNKCIYVIGNIILSAHAIVGILVFILTWITHWQSYLSLG